MYLHDAVGHVWSAPLGADYTRYLYLRIVWILSHAYTPCLLLSPSQQGNAAVLLDLYKVYPDILLQPLDVDYSPTLLHLAAVKLKRGVVQAVLGLPRVIVDIEDENGQTPFCWVVTM